MQNIGRYEIIEQIGAGAMGRVYKARDPLMGRDVAIKTILAQAIEGPDAQEFRDRFFREAKAAGRLVHPGIVTVHDVSEYEGTPFLVMEFVAGRTLHAVLSGGERLDIDRICDIGIQLAEALNYAHQNGVVHRDIKPANILVAGDQRTKIADFGIAKLLESQVTATGQLLGTPLYMAPEQFTGAQIDGRADLFALGVVLYWMATGDKPFTGDSVLSIQYKVVNTDPVAPRQLNPSLPRDLEALILKSLEKDPAERYQTGEEIARDLRAVRERRPVLSPPVAASASDTMATRVRPDTRFTPATGSPPPAVLPPPRKTGRLLIAALMVLVAGFVTIGLVQTLKPKPETPPNTAVPQAVAPVEPKPAPTSNPAPSAGVQRGADADKAVKTAVDKPPDNSVSPAKTEPTVATPQAIAESRGATPAAELPASETTLPDNEATTSGNRNVIGSIVAQKRLAQSANAARLVITSPAVPEFVSVVVRLDNGLLFRHDATISPPGPEEGRRRGQSRAAIPFAPLAEERLLPPGQHRVQVNVVMGTRRIGQTEEVAGQFDPGQRRTLQIQFNPEAIRSGAAGRGVSPFSVTLR